MPRVQKIEKLIFTIDELRDAAHESIKSGAYEKAINRISDWQVCDSFWYESIYEDAKVIGLNIRGFDIDRASYCDGKLTESVHDVCRAIVAKNGKDCDTFKLAESYLTQIDRLLAVAALIDWFALLTADPDSKFYPEGFQGINWAAEQAREHVDNEIEPEFLNKLCQEYLSILKAEYEYRTSEQAALEFIEANDYEFDCNGYIA